MNVLVDTSVWSLTLRKSAALLNRQELLLAAELRELISEGRVRMIGPIRQELLSGIREEAQYLRLQKVLRAFEDQVLTTEDYEVAALFGHRCRGTGIMGSVVDFFICAVAVRRTWDIFTSDHDFKSFARAIPIMLHAPRAPKRAAKGPPGEETVQ